MWSEVAAALASHCTVVRLAARHPALLRGLAVLNSAAHYPDRSTWDARMRAVSEGGMQAIADSSVERWLTPAFRQTPAAQAMAGRLREVLLRTYPVAYTRTCEAIADMDLRAGNRRIDIPTLIIAGRQDMATPLSMSQGMAADIAKRPAGRSRSRTHQCGGGARRDHAAAAPLDANASRMMAAA